MRMAMTLNNYFCLSIIQGIYFLTVKQKNKDFDAQNVLYLIEDKQVKNDFYE